MLSRLTSGKSLGQIDKRLHAGAVKRIQDILLPVLNSFKTTVSCSAG